MIELDEDEESEEELENGKGVVNDKPRKALQPIPFGTSVKIWEFEGGGIGVFNCICICLWIHSKLLNDVHLSSYKPMEPHIAIWTE